MNKTNILIVLYGDSNVGKTTSLKRLLALLLNDSPCVLKAINKFTGDGRFILKYMNKCIFICTGGDSWQVCRVNTEFFTKDFTLNTDIWQVNFEGIRKLTNEEKSQFKSEESLCNIFIGACRPDGDNYGALKAMHYFCEQNINKISKQVWMRKDYPDEEQAKLILQQINE